MKVDQLLSNPVKHLEPQSANVSSMEELLELPWIKDLANNDAKFYRFSCIRMNDNWILTAELHGVWHVMALVSGEDSGRIIDSLPMWTPSKSRST
jgi:hypothetical protein